LKLNLKIVLKNT
jgi:hypothetical protein